MSKAQCFIIGMILATIWVYLYMDMRKTSLYIRSGYERVSWIKTSDPMEPYQQRINISK